jgi:acetyl esterase/lipase
MRASSLLLGLLVVCGQVCPLQAQETASPPAIRIVPNLAYVDGEKAHPVKHRLDLYLPPGKTCFPVLFFVHGGAWVHGDKDFLGLYSGMGKAFAKQGVGTVVINYRLTPEVKHPEHARDVAKAFRWTCDHIGEYGGDTERIVLCGHSAGGHLVSLLACNTDLQKEAGIDPKRIKCVVPLSGVHRVRKGFLPPVFPAESFGLNPSPVDLVRRGLPPFLLVYANADLPTCGKSECESFAGELKKCGVPVENIELAGTHVTTLLKAWQPTSPVMKAILKALHEPNPAPPLPGESKP